MTLLSTRVSLTSAPGQLHDFFSGDSARATPPHMLDQGAAAIAHARRDGALDPDSVPIQFEFNLGIGQQTELPSYRERNCDLAFAGDSQVVLLLVRVLPRRCVGQRQKMLRRRERSTVNPIRHEHYPNTRR
jgi:hypothetical protein